MKFYSELSLIAKEVNFIDYVTHIPGTAKRVINKPLQVSPDWPYHGPSEHWKSTEYREWYRKKISPKAEES